MRPPRPLIARSIAAAAALASVVGCTELLGLERVSGGGCAGPSDCGGALACIDGVCGMPPALPVDARVPTPDAPEADPPGADGDANALDDGDANALDDGDGSKEGGGDVADGSDGEPFCAASCRPYDECVDGRCIESVKEGIPVGTPGAGVSLQPEELTCFQQTITACGDLAGVGIQFTYTIQGSIRLAVYNDNGGSPSTRIAQTDGVPVNGTGVDLAVSPVVSVGCDATHDAYWVCLAANLVSPPSGTVATLEVPSNTKWVTTDASLPALANDVDGGLPAEWTGSEPTDCNCDTPVVYPWIALSGT
jgi:hypothetical protein